MRVCPVCKTSYDDDVEVCANDGEALIEGAESLPENPEMASVVEVDPDEATAMVDLERLSPVIKERLDEREERLAEERVAEAQRLAKAAADADPEATGTAFAPDLSRLTPDDEDDDFDPNLDSTAPSLPSGQTVLDGPTGYERNAPTQRVRSAPADKPKGKGCVVFFILLFGLLAAGGIGGGAWYYFGRGEVLTVTTTPPGATVTLDGKVIGKSPVQRSVRPGSHTLGLELEGYEPFKEVIDVEKGKPLPFLQPLKALKGTRPPQTRPGGDGDTQPKVDPEAARKQRVEELVASVEAHLGADDLERALADVKELLKLAPNDERADALFDKVTAARTDAAAPSDRRRRGRKAARRGGPSGSSQADDEPSEDEKIIGIGKLPPGERKSRSRKAYQAGERFFRNGRMADAKREFKTAVQMDPRFALPHRSVARIYQREGDVGRARYHLKRYLKLGGADPDFRVKRWLEQHP